MVVWAQAVPEDYDILTITKHAVADRCSLLSDAYYESLGGLPMASVVITFHSGETWYNLLHTLHSIFQRTPSRLLHEVILVDDFSNKGSVSWLGCEDDCDVRFRF